MANFYVFSPAGNSAPLEQTIQEHICIVKKTDGHVVVGSNYGKIEKFE